MTGLHHTQVAKHTHTHTPWLLLPHAMHDGRQEDIGLGGQQTRFLGTEADIVTTLHHLHQQHPEGDSAGERW